MAEGERAERLLAMVLVHLMAGSPQRDKVDALHRAGLSPSEIADLIDTSAATVRQQLYEVRQGRKKGSGQSPKSS